MISPPPWPEKQLTLHISGLLLTRDGTLLLLLSPSAAAHHLFLFHSVEVGAVWSREMELRNEDDAH